jgi:FMN reductase
MSQVILLSGSPSAKSKSSTLLEYAGTVLTSRGITTASVSVLDFPAEDLIQARYDSAAFDGFKQQIADARALVIGTPVYKGAYTGSLKALLDILPQYGLLNKTVVPVVTGGSLAHLLAIEYALKPVLSVLGATDLRRGVYIADSQFQYAEDGFRLEDAVQERIDASLQHLVQTLQSPAA